MRTIRVDIHAEQTVFRGWGTSLAWWANAVGRWPRVEREPVVRGVFGMADGGLGMTIARFNAGGGENPGLASTLQARMVMEGYREAPDADLDPNADPGQRAILSDAARIAAEEHGQLTVEVFGNSPPWWATISGSVTGSRGRGSKPAPNLAPDHARDYLCYLADVADLVERDAGVHVTSLSPFNEPTARWWVHGGRQEGCYFTRGGIDGLLGELAQNPELHRGRVVAASEEWSLEQATATWDALSAKAREVVGRINVHTYDGDTRAAVRARAARSRLPLWVSEFGEGGAFGRELALGIVHDLRELSPSAWVLWQAVSPDAWGPLRLGPGADVRVAPKLAVLARFTRSIRPGMTLVGTDDPLSVAAVGHGRLAVVVVAEHNAERVVHLHVPGASITGPAEVEIVNAMWDGGAPSHFRVGPDDGTLDLLLPAGCVASLTMPIAARGDDKRFLGSGTWWLVHESGSRLGLSAAREQELFVGVEVAGVAPDDGALAQRWRAEACGDGSARWVCEASGHQLDVWHRAKRSGARVVQWRAGVAERAPVNSRFDVVDAGERSVMLVARHSGHALALDRRGRGVQRSVGEPGTRWRLVRAGALLG